MESGQYMSCMTTESRNRYDVLENRMTTISKSSFKQWCLTIPPISTKRSASSHLTNKLPRHMMLKRQVLASDMHNNMAGVSWYMG